MEHYFDPKVECASREQITAWQNERLVRQVERVYNNVPYYKKKMDELGVRPEHIHGIEDLHLLPTLSKDDLRDQYPYGLMAAPLSDCVRIHSTSGTTGRRVVAFYTQHDVDLWEECCARALAAAAQELSLQQERRRTMWCRSVTDMDFLPAERAFTAVPTSWEA